MQSSGAHSVALYNAESAKTQVWKSAVRASAVAGALFIAVNQQAYADIAPRIFAPSVAGATPRVPALVSAAPQLFDFTLQPLFDAPQSFGATPRAPALIQAAPQSIDLTLQPFFDVPQSIGATPRITQLLQASPQSVDLTLQPFIDAPQSAALISGPAPSSQYQFGTHAAVIYNAETLKTQLWESASGVGSASNKLGKWTASAPQAIDLTLQAFFDAPVISQGWILSYISASPDPTEYPTIRGYLTPTAKQAIVIGPSLGTVVGVGQQAYADAQPRVYPAVISGNVPITGPVPLPVRAAPQFFDATLQAFYDSPQAGPLVGPVPPPVRSAPQQFDFTLQPNFSYPLIIGQGKLGAFTQIPPQQYDYTLQATYTSPLSAAIVFAIKSPIQISMDDYGRRLIL